MLSPELGRVAFQIAFFVTLVSGGLLFFLTPGSAEFVITVASLVVGLVFVLLVAVLVRWSNR